MKYIKKKIVIIEAFQLPELEDDNLEPFFKWVEENGFTNYTSEKDGTLSIETSMFMTDPLIAYPGDFIIKDNSGEVFPGEFFPMNAKTFHKIWKLDN